MKRILLVLLLAVALGGCATLSNMYKGVKDRIYPPPKPIVTEKPQPPPAPPVEPLIKVPEPKEEVAPIPKKPRRIKFRPKKTTPKPKRQIEAVSPDKKDDLQKEPTPPKGK